MPLTETIRANRLIWRSVLRWERGPGLAPGGGGDRLIDLVQWYKNQFQPSISKLKTNPWANSKVPQLQSYVKFQQNHLI